MSEIPPVVGLVASAAPPSDQLHANHAASGGASVVVAEAANKQTLLVSHKQKGNPLLPLLRHVFWEYAELPAGDYCMGAGLIAFYLSLRFHALKPLYLGRRLAELNDARSLKLRVLLVQIDVEDPVRPLQAVTLAALNAGCTVICASSAGEAARYLETFKAYELKGAAAIQERVATAFLPQVRPPFCGRRSCLRTSTAPLPFCPSPRPQTP